MRRVLASALAALCLAAFSSTASSDEPARPNILIFMTDDQRADGTLQVMRKTREWFRNGGITYPNAWATTPLCCPSRATIFSGRYAHNHGVTTNRLARNLDQGATIQAYLRDGGYTTAYMGKFLNRWGVRENPPPHFDRWATFIGGYFDEVFNVDGEIRRRATYSTDFLRDQAVRVLNDFEDRDDKPWLMYVATSAPHSPYLPEPEYDDAPVGPRPTNEATSEIDRSDKPLYVQEANATDRRARIVRAGQLRTLMSVDDLVGRVMSELGDLDEDGNTLAIFMSDNGFYWGEHELLLKRAPYTQGVRIPLMVRWPRRLDGGSVDRSNVATVDIAPMVLEAAGVNGGLEYPLDGRSLLSDHERDEILIEHWNQPETEVPTYAGLRSLDRVYTEYYGFVGLPATEREYYDLRSDPLELVNLLGDDDPTNDPDPAEQASLSDRLGGYRSCTGETCP